MPQIAGFRGVVPVVGSDPRVVATDLAGALVQGAVVRDATRSVYRYKQTFPGAGRTLVRKAFICAVRLTEWDEGSVRPHEAVRPAERDAALAAARAARSYGDPVVAGYRDASGEVERHLRRGQNGKPIADFTTPDGTNHRVWRIQDAEIIGKLRHLFAPKKLHVLEGHARYEAMLAYRDELNTAASLAMYSSANYALAHLVDLDDPTLAAAPRHRVVRATGVSRETVLAKVAPHFIIEKLAGAAKDPGTLQRALGDTVAHQPAFVAVFPNEPDAWKLTLKPDVSPVAEGVAVDRAIQKLDPIAIEYMFLARAFSEPAITSTTDSDAALAELDTGAAVVLIVRPVSVAQIALTDEVGGRLPAGSTAFYPATQSMVGFVVDPDEDLV